MNGVLRLPSSIWALFAKETQWLIILGKGSKNVFALMIKPTISDIKKFQKDICDKKNVQKYFIGGWKVTKMRCD